MNFTSQGKKIIGIGRNYFDHVKELNNKVPKNPFFFLKPTTSYLKSNQNIQIPKNIVCHHEVELGVIIGRSITSLNLSNYKKPFLSEANSINSKENNDKKEEDIEVYKKLYDDKIISGYCLSIDLTARNLQEDFKKLSLPWSIVKGLDTFCPVGKFIPSEKISNPNNLNLWLKVNDQIKQNSSTQNMIFKIPELISYCSGIMTLEEGDLILTGTPAGVSQIKSGDKVEAGLEQNEGNTEQTELLDCIRFDAVDRIDGLTYDDLKPF
ncbi:hypothetical protein BY996DRAFT_6417647 [Phakopsora pachyrhizi]|uniref:Fumarylacetoacetase-like C-terminal domain-containing protein n=1 Tax=Phakopsora pachyrhizi TaxID=170000 RepID=A0AAV0ARE1_PHAPC|nr:hypothetical protein BY996DRAFT_6417647 [Phakopsora pachyrhizi]CAH7670569.1 hypothetical protein PPACK8108_LOCUS5299 [Phakopsora pachyrhizi]